MGMIATRIELDEPLALDALVALMEASTALSLHASIKATHGVISYPRVGELAVSVQPSQELMKQYTKPFVIAVRSLFGNGNDYLYQHAMRAVVELGNVQRPLSDVAYRTYAETRWWFRLVRWLGRNTRLPRMRIHK